MDKRVIDQFWRQRATEGGGRWTEPEMLDYELSMLTPYVGANCHILDLGSGPAALSTRLLGPSCRLTAVDKYQSFLDSIPSDPRINTVCSDVVNFSYTTATYDLILLFGVVTHLDLAEELAVYENAARGLADSGVLAVKNQSSHHGEKQVDGYSESLKCHYVGRYPDIPGQAARLGRFFGKVEIRHYPPAFDKWPDTTHVCFLCSSRK
ncbi:MAG: class I SAM-dependent methyltransferase [Sulfuritalea sp.]|nr:class I SAM-dependent methyltransferase [Sulfuritalea sp.]